MRLEQLTMHNFGPYRHETVDFLAFETTPLFLITGHTGSGKTTIFDGLVYALYGTTSGDDRDGTQMRANFATTAEKTQVQLTFSHEGATYVIARAPEQRLAKKRGTGDTVAKASVSLTRYVDGVEQSQLTKIQPVRQAIEDLLHLDADQFRQMVLLPQGKFRQFLDANSEAKEALLRHLFNTDLFARWQQQLRDLTKKEQATIGHQEARLATLASQFTYLDARPAEAAPLADQLAAMGAALAQMGADTATKKTAHEAAQTAYAKANAAYQQDSELAAAFTRQKAAEAALAKLAVEAPALAQMQSQQAALEWAKTQESAWVQLNRAKEHQGVLEQGVKTQTAAVAAAKTTAQTTTAALTTLEKQAEAIQEARQSLAELRRLAPLLEAKKQTQSTLTQVQKQLSQALQALQDAQSVQTAVTAKLDAALTAQEAAAAIDHTQALQAAHTQVTRLDDLAQQLQTTTHTLTRVNAEEQATATAKEAATAALAAATAAYQTLHDAALRNQIAVLAARLTPGGACPVCGSLEHPTPAPSEAGAAVSATELEAADDVRSQKQADLAAITAAQAALKTRQQELDTQQLELTAAIQQAAGAETTATAEQTVRAAHAHLKQLQEEAAALTAQRKTLKVQVATLQTERQTADEALRAAEKAVQAARLEEAKATTAAQAAAAAVPKGAPALATLAAEQTTLAAQIATYEQDLKAAQEAATTARDQHTKAQATLAGTQKQLENQRQATQEAQRVLDAALVAQFGSADASKLVALLDDLPRLAELTATLTQAREAKLAQEALLEQARRQTQNHQPPDLAACHEARKIAQEAQEAAQQALVEARTREAANRQLYDQLTSAFAKNQAQLTALATLQDLSAVLNGTNEQKLSLERYVLRAYLTRVLEVGTVRLQRLTNGRYQFQLHQDPGSHRNDSGLEIDVYDDQVGAVRSVHTLSGGESFIAALSLALALGEVIQQESGGITIDALFIDEGFGSLDAESLSTALEALEQLDSQARMIGIISHVESLRQDIPDQLQVTATGAGDSHIRAVHLAW